MTEQHFLDQKNIKIEKERPTFLTVLCIITFIVSGFMFISNSYRAITYSQDKQLEYNEFEIEQTIEWAEMLSGGESLPGLDEQIVMMELRQKEEMENHALLTIIGLLSIVLSLLGAFFMYRLRKLGFHLYTLSKVIALVPLLIFTLTSAIVWTLSIGAIIGAIFIFMYSRNLKYMN